VPQTLINILEFDVRFSEADPLGIVWHGHYIRYFEDGRESFGKQYGLGYLDFFRNGFVIPVVKLECEYKRSLKYGDRVLVETEFVPVEAAKVIFRYRLLNSSTMELAATGSSIQVFLDKDETILQLNNPPFFYDWKKQNGLI
jgi:acyl-CoA thioester hydrolase